MLFHSSIPAFRDINANFLCTVFVLFTLFREFESKSLRLVRHSSSRGITFLVGTPRNEPPQQLRSQARVDQPTVFYPPLNDSSSVTRDAHQKHSESECINCIPCFDNERVVTILFDRNIFSEKEARNWWEDNKHLSMLEIL